MPEPNILENVRSFAKYTIENQMQALANSEHPIVTTFLNEFNDPQRIALEEARQQGLEKRFPSTKAKGVEAMPKYDEGLIYCLQAGYILKLGVTDNSQLRMEVIGIAQSFISKAKDIYMELMPDIIFSEKNSISAQKERTSQEKKEAMEIFLRYKGQNNKPPTWKILLKELESTGFKDVKHGTIQGWLTEFKKNSE